MSALIGLDVGTTNTKAVAFDPATGRVVAVAARPTPLTTPAPGWSEIDPSHLWETVVACLRQVMGLVPAPALALGVASMAEAGVPLDASGRPLYRIIHWYDRRSEPQYDRVMAEVGAAHLFRLTGQAPRLIYTLYKLLWLREHQPAVLAALHRWLSVSDFVAWRLTGAAATDFSLASRTMLFDPRRRQWSPEMLELAGVRPEQLPAPGPSGEPIGRVTREAAAETGLPAGIPVAIGGHDHLCGALAAGAVAPGQVVDSIGTAEGLVIPTEVFVDDDRLWQSRICCYAHVVPGLFVVQGGLGMSGGGLAWIASRLFAGETDPVAVALHAAGAVPPGAAGLLYLPYLGGNGTPVGDEQVAAAFVGLRSPHDRGHLTRAVLEGIAFAVRHSLEVTGQLVGEHRPPIQVVGGGSRSPLWLQLRASILGQPLLAVEVTEAVALGAALLAGVGAGLYPDAAAAADAVDRQVTLYHPDPRDEARYRELYEEGYLRLYPALAPVFGALARFTT